MSDYLAEKIDLDGVAAKLLTRAGWINLKPLLGKTFRLFGNQKVPDMGVIGGKIQVLFLWKLGSWPWRFDGFDKLTRLDWAFDWAHAEVSPNVRSLTVEAHTLSLRKTFSANPKYSRSPTYTVHLNLCWLSFSRSRMYLLWMGNAIISFQ